MELVEHRFRSFRRALRREDQEIFDELMRSAKFHVQAGVLAANPNPVDSMLIAMLIEQQRSLRQLRNEVEQIKQSADNRVHL